MSARHLVNAAQGLRFLVLDELHTYRGRQGADVSMLVRRVREALHANQMQCIGTSATLAGAAAWNSSGKKLPKWPPSCLVILFIPKMSSEKHCAGRPKKIDLADEVFLARSKQAFKTWICLIHMMIYSSSAGKLG